MESWKFYLLYNFLCSTSSKNFSKIERLFRTFYTKQNSKCSSTKWVKTLIFEKFGQIFWKTNRKSSNFFSHFVTYIKLFRLRWSPSYHPHSFLSQQDVWCYSTRKWNFACKTISDMDEQKEEEKCINESYIWIGRWMPHKMVYLHFLYLFFLSKKTPVLFTMSHRKNVFFDFQCLYLVNAEY